MPARPWVIAHRGHSAAERENSLAALDRAVEAQADAVECDVRIAGDGVLVVSHDPDLARLTGEQVPVEATPSDRLDAIAQRAGASIPRLTTLMATARGRVPLMLDVKSLEPAVITGIANAVETVDFDPADLAVGLRSPDLIGATARHLNAARILALNGSDRPLDPYLDQGVDLVRVWEHAADPPTLDALKRRGCMVWVTTGGPQTGRAVGDADLAVLSAVLMAGADGILVNDPDLGRRAVDAAG